MGNTLGAGGTAAAAPPPFRPSDPALCGSRSLVTPYYCRLGDLLCYSCLLYLSLFCVCMHICNLCFLCVLLCYFPLQLSPSVLWYCWLGLLTCKNRLPYNLYCVGGDVKHCSINQSTLGAPCVSSRVRLIQAENFQRKSYVRPWPIKLSVGNPASMHHPVFWWVDRGSIWASFSPQILSESSVSSIFFHSWVVTSLTQSREIFPIGVNGIEQRYF